MPSTFTTNEGFEQPATGEQSGTWGATLNGDLGFIDSSINGVLIVPLSGTSFTLTTTPGISSNGRARLIVFAGSATGTVTVTIAPSTVQKVYFIVNTANQALTVTQGSGSSVSIPASFSKVVYCDGAGATASVHDAHQVNSDQIVEGAVNLFFTNTRAQGAARTALSAGTGISYNNSTGVITWLATALQAAGDLAYNSGTATMSYSFWTAPWQTATLLGSFTSYGRTPRYRKAANNYVYLDGGVVMNGSMANMFQLPAGYRPATPQYVACSIPGSLGAQSILIDTDGTVKQTPGPASGFNVVTFNGVLFTLDA